MESLTDCEEAVATSPSDPDHGDGGDTHNGHPALAPDAPDFSIQRGLYSDGKRQRPSLVLPATVQSPTLGSPDSDTDVLGYLDYTPDPFLDSADHGVGSVDYSKVYEQLRYTELMPGVFIPRKPLNLRITEVQMLHSTIQLFSNYLLVISLEHGEHQWTVKRKVRQVASLHGDLILLRTRLKMPAATRVTRARRESMRQQIKQADKGVDTVDGEVEPYNRRLLKFPRSALQTMDDGVKSELETYLRNILHHSLFRSHQAVLEFFEISPISFIRELGVKQKEGYVKKRTGGGGTNTGCCSWITSGCSGKYKVRWLVVRETYLFFLVPETGRVRGVLLMDAGFQVSHSYRLIGARNSLLISNLSRSVVIKCDSENSKKEWLTEITHSQQKYAKEFTSQDTRFGSFAPIRPNSYARWYVDGARYMWDVGDMLEMAKEEVFITDWWMSPQIYLKRPDLTGHKWRLAEVLRRKAEAGVHIFILLYKEVELALGISSLLSKHTLNQLHPNIKVLRHPDHIAGGVLYWAHHEKLVIIDQAYAFVSGIDLAFGRWDDYRHKLVDVGHAGLQQPHISPGREAGTYGPSRGALQHLVRGTNEVLINTVTRSNPSSSCSSPVTARSSPTTYHTPPITAQSSPPSYHSSMDGVGNVTLSTTLSSDILHPSDSDIAAKTVSEENIMNHRDSGERNVSDQKVSDETEVYRSEKGRDAKSVHMKERTESDLSTGSKKGEDVTDRSASTAATLNDIGNGKESTPLRSRTKKSNAKTRFLLQSKPVRESKRNDDSGSDDEMRDVGRFGRSMKGVRRIGLDLMDEVRERGREVRAWTANKLHRRGSGDSDVSEDEEQDQGPGGSLYRRHGGLQHMGGSCSSLAAAHSQVTMEDTTSIHLWVGKDYVNWISKDLNNLDEPFKDSVDRHQTPRMPWHDIGLFVEGLAARDAARHFIQRWNAVKTEKVKANHSYPYLLPRTYDRSSFTPSPFHPKHRVKCQVVRSVGRWSCGLDETESSIFSAYVDLIRGAKHYIYIENQFFITRADLTEVREVTNYIGHEIVGRIVKAHQNNEKFRVYVLLPLLPAFEGMIGKSSGVAMQYIVYWNYVSISRGKSSIIQCLRERGVSDWQRYISFCSLRTHELLGGRPVSELVYIHSKLIIVDDCKVIAGSANINDRSLSGSRDSEVCLVIEDQEFESGTINGVERDCGVFAGSMRRYIFSEHLGLADTEDPHIDVSDPVADSFFTDVWCCIARRNAEIYEEVFSCYPCNSATTFADVEQLRHAPTMAEVNPADAMVKLREIQGHLVEFPIDFLKNETLKPGVGNKEFLLPMETWT